MTRPEDIAVSPPRAFTLIELLVAIGVIGALSCLAYGGYRTALDKTESTRCFANMRTLGQGILLFAQDQGMFPKTSHSGASWARSIAPYVEQPLLATGSEYRSQTVFLCPSNRIKSSDGQPAMSYGMNVFFELTSERRYTPAGMPIMSRDSYEGSPAIWHRPVNVPFPSKTVLLAESTNTAPGADHFMAHQWQTTLAAETAVDTQRHATRSNFVFVDGHVESRPISSTFDPSSQVNQWNPSLAGKN